MRKKAVFGNWKMNKLPDEAKALAQALREGFADFDAIELAVFPPSISLSIVADALNGSLIGVGTQNIHFEEQGAFTGEISAGMAKTSGARYTLIGHSERRHVFGETDEWVNLKLKAALKAGLIPVVCVGETLGQREDGSTSEVVKTQIIAALEGIERASTEKIIVAYEPVWAIGTGKTASPLQAQEVHELIRRMLEERFDGEVSETIRILYGGSVKPGNTAELIAQKDIDGALVGGASLDAGSFEAIARAANLT